MKKKILILLPMVLLFSFQTKSVNLIDALDLAARGPASSSILANNTIHSNMNNFYLSQAIAGGTKALAGVSKALMVLSKTGISIAPPAAASAGILAKVSGWISGAIPLIILNVALSWLSHSLQPSQEDPSLENQINLKMRALAQLEQYKNSPNPAERELYKKLRATYTEDMLGYVNG